VGTGGCVRGTTTGGGRSPAGGDGIGDGCQAVRRSSVAGTGGPDAPASPSVTPGLEGTGDGCHAARRSPVSTAPSRSASRVHGWPPAQPAVAAMSTIRKSSRLSKELGCIGSEEIQDASDIPASFHAHHRSLTSFTALQAGLRSGCALFTSGHAHTAQAQRTGTAVIEQASPASRIRVGRVVAPVPAALSPRL
jgi:hypothetical protein